MKALTRYLVPAAILMIVGAVMRREWLEPDLLRRESERDDESGRDERPLGIYAHGRRAQFGGRSRRNRSTVAYACLQSEVSSATLAP